MDAFDDSPSLERLVALASAGDEGAILELHKRYNGVVCRDALTYLKVKGCNEAVAHSEDIIAKAWFSILGHIGQLEDTEKIKAWMSTIILNMVRGHVSGPKGCISNQKKRAPLEAAEEGHIDGGNKLCENAVLANEIREQAYAKSWKFGEIIRLHLEEGYTMEEVAEQFSESPAKLRSMYYRNLSDLRKFFRDDNDGKDDTSES